MKWACPPEKATHGEAHEPLYCISECTDKCASPFLIAALTHSVRTNHHKGLYISATALSGCERKFFLERVLDYADYMKHSFYSYRGTVMHQVVEDASSVDLGGISLDTLGFLTEWRMATAFCFEHGAFELPQGVSPFDDKTWDKVTCPECRRSRRKLDSREWFILGGTLDGLEPIWKDFDEETGVLPAILWDLKTMQEYAASYFIKGNKKNKYHPHVKDEHYNQAQVYRYLAERSTPPEALAEKGVKRLRLVESNIQAFSMGHFPRTGSTYMWKEHYKKPEKKWTIPAIGFESDTWVEDYIKARAYPIYKSLIKRERRPTICEPDSNKPEEHSWQCRFCAFHKSTYCPNPSKEWALLQEGMDPDEAYQLTRDST